VKWNDTAKEHRKKNIEGTKYAGIIRLIQQQLCVSRQ